MISREYFSDPRALTGDGVFYRENELPMGSLFPKEVLNWVIATFRPNSVLDLGCGTGKSLDYFLDAGIDAVGVEGSQLAISKAKSSERILRRDMREPLWLNRRFELVWCFEVLEHLPEKFADQLVQSMTIHSDVVLVSAARPGQGGEGHFNEQPPDYWIKKFAEKSYVLLEPETHHVRNLDSHWGPNLMVFKRR